MTEEKKTKGRKRHIAVDILGDLLHVKVHAANIHDTKAGCSIFEITSEKYPSIKAFSADAGYRGTSVDYVQDFLKKFIDISKKIKDEFAILPKRWIVERTFSWINNFRRASKDFEILTLTAENVVRIAMIRVTLKNCF
jgi:putative transposase